jgi:hypothetical protein
MTLKEMDAWASQVYATLKVTEQEEEAKAVYRLGEFIRELGRRLEELGRFVDTVDQSMGDISN